MPRVFDNIDQSFLPALKQTLDLSDRADFCIGYFNLRGWKQLDHCIESWSGAPDRCARLLVGMQRPPQEELRLAMSLVDQEGQLDNQTVLQLKKKLALVRLARSRSSSSCFFVIPCTPSSTCCSAPTRSTRSSATSAAAT
jgi:hypothetical protein